MKMFFSNLDTLAEWVKAHQNSSARPNTETVNQLASKSILFLGLKHSWRLAALWHALYRTDLSMFSLSIDTFSAQVNRHSTPARHTGLLAVIKHTWCIPVLGSWHLLLSFPGILCYKYLQSVLPHFTSLVPVVSYVIIQMPVLLFISLEQIPNGQILGQ